MTNRRRWVTGLIIAFVTSAAVAQEPAAPQSEADKALEGLCTLIQQEAAAPPSPTASATVFCAKSRPLFYCAKKSDC